MGCCVGQRTKAYQSPRSVSNWKFTRMDVPRKSVTALPISVTLGKCRELRYKVKRPKSQARVMIHA